MSEKNAQQAAFIVSGLLTALGMDFKQIVDDRVNDRCAHRHGTTRHNGDESLNEGTCFFCSKAECKNECMDEEGEARS